MTKRLGGYLGLFANRIPSRFRDVPDQEQKHNEHKGEAAQKIAQIPEGPMEKEAETVSKKNCDADHNQERQTQEPALQAPGKLNRLPSCHLLRATVDSLHHCQDHEDQYDNRKKNRLEHSFTPFKSRILPQERGKVQHLSTTMNFGCALNFLAFA